MNAFDKASQIEQKGMDVLTPFLQRSAFDGRFVLLAKGSLARHLQETVGDAIFNSSSSKFWTVEIKAEAENRHGNIFLETWSNRNLDDRASHADRGSNPGWLYKLRCDLLFYYFVSDDALYIFNFFKLKQWAFGTANQGPRLYAFPEKAQSKYAQPNDTHGRCVPIDVLQKEVGFRLLRPRQIPLFAEMESVP